jgi:catechol 2,3-dioxygenase-like lactoylglutathione lyase family enzyme
MGVHHIAIATPQIDAMHGFYTEAMGFELVKAVVNPTPEGGWAKHVFYDTGDGQMIAFWDLHGEFTVPTGGLAGSVGLPDWTNHLAFTAADRTALDVARDRWLAVGCDVVEIDHEFCVSIYTNDPDGTLVEWCMDTRPLNEGDRTHAIEAIGNPAPTFDDPPQGFNAYAGDPSLRPSWWPNKD